MFSAPVICEYLVSCLKATTSVKDRYSPKFASLAASIESGSTTAHGRLDAAATTRNQTPRATGPTARGWRQTLASWLGVRRQTRDRRSPGGRGTETARSVPAHLGPGCIARSDTGRGGGSRATRARLRARHGRRGEAWCLVVRKEERNRCDGGSSRGIIVTLTGGSIFAPTHWRTSMK
jgi:hypothetical protein